MLVALGWFEMPEKCILPENQKPENRKPNFWQNTRFSGKMPVFFWQNARKPETRKPKTRFLAKFQKCILPEMYFARMPENVFCRKICACAETFWQVLSEFSGAIPQFRTALV